MTAALAAACAAVLAVAAGWHLYWGLGGRLGLALALPTRLDGTPVMAFNRVGASLVGLVLAGMALLPLSAARFAPPEVPGGALRVLLAIQGLLLVARGLAWHRYVGLFKTVRATRFGRWDTAVFSPLALTSGCGCLLQAIGH